MAVLSPVRLLLLSIALLFSLHAVLHAQPKSDSSQIIITPRPAPPPPPRPRYPEPTILVLERVMRAPIVFPLNDVTGMGIYASKKSESIPLRLIDANLSTNNTRQLFSHTPGLFIWEFNGSGLQANVSARGLNPHRSSEFNVRMNGYDIASDPYGYPEAHFTPPFESLERVEVVRGAAGLQYGAQFGGLLNYVMKASPEDRKIAFETSQFGGSYGLYSTHTSAAGLFDFYNSGLSYNAYLNYRRSDGWREKGGYHALTGHVAATWATESRAHVDVPETEIGIELTALDFKEQMPNGLTEQQYAENPRASYRTRDWFGAPRLMGALTLHQSLDNDTRLSVIASGLAGDRNSITLVSGTAVADTGTNRRRVNRDIFRDAALESRLLTQFVLSADNTVSASLSTGFRVARTSTNRSQGLGKDGSEFDLEYVGPKTLDLDFVTWNLAAFGEMVLYLNHALAVVPGVRIEHLSTNALGVYSRERSATSPDAFDTIGPPTAIDRTLEETFPLFGLGVKAYVLDDVYLYANIAQAYRPLLYAQQFPYDQSPVDTTITSSKGYSSDLGLRCSFGNLGSFDANLFLLEYGNRVGIIFPDSALYPRGFRTNVGASTHYGVEFAGHIDLLQLDDPNADINNALELFLSAGYTHATYTSGPVEGNEVENSPDWIVRTGLTSRFGDDFSATLEASYTSSAFSDAANTPFRADGQQGIIPDYTLFDFSIKARITPYLKVEGSINNILDRRYFTARATAYPGPGILPGEGRTFTAGVRVNL